MTPIMQLCLNTATLAHRGQKRKFSESHLDYIVHPIRVAKNFMNDELLFSASILHDVVEDTDYDYEKLKQLGIPEDILRIVNILTKREDQTYTDYIKDILNNNSASKIKLADLRDNLKTVPEGSMKDKYQLAEYIISDWIEF